MDQQELQKRVYIFTIALFFLVVEWALLLFDLSTMAFVVLIPATGEALRVARAFIISKTDANSRPLLKFLVIDLLPFHACLIWLLSMWEPTAIQSLVPSVNGAVGMSHRQPDPLWIAFVYAAFCSLLLYSLFASSVFFHWFWARPQRRRSEYFWFVGCFAIFASVLWRFASIIFLGKPIALTVVLAVMNSWLIHYLQGRVNAATPKWKRTIRTAILCIAGAVVFLTVVVAGTIVYPWFRPVRYIAIPGAEGTGNVLIMEFWNIGDSGIVYERDISEFPNRLMRKYHPIWRGRSWIYNVEKKSLKPQPWRLTDDARYSYTPVFHERAGLLLTIRTEMIMGGSQSLHTYSEKMTIEVYDKDGRLITEKDVSLSQPYIYSYGQGPNFLITDQDRGIEDAGYLWNGKTGRKTELRGLKPYWLTGCSYWECRFANGKFFFTGIRKNDPYKQGLYSLNIKSGISEELLPFSGPFAVTHDGQWLVIGVSKKNSKAMGAKYRDTGDKTVLISLWTGEMTSSIDELSRFYSFQPSGKAFAMNCAHRRSIDKLCIIGTDVELQDTVEIPSKTSVSLNSFYDYHWVTDEVILISNVKYRDDAGQEAQVFFDRTTGKFTTPRGIATRDILFRPRNDN